MKLNTFYYIKVDLCLEQNILEALNQVKKTFKSIRVLSMHMFEMEVF